MVTKKEEFIYKNHVADEVSQRQLQKQQMLFDQRQRDIQVGSCKDIVNHFKFAIFQFISKILPSVFFVGIKAYSSNYQSWYAVHANEISRGVL